MKRTKLSSKEEVTFQTDLSEAHKVENKLADYYKANYNCKVETSQKLGSFPAWDLSIYFIDHDVNLTFECKQDKMVWTGNVAVENQRTLKNGIVQPTCISISKADICSYYFNGTYYLIPTDELRQMIKNKLYSVIVANAGGDNQTSIYLFPVNIFTKYATDIRTLLGT